MRDWLTKKLLALTARLKASADKAAKTSERRWLDGQGGDHALPEADREAGDDRGGQCRCADRAGWRTTEAGARTRAEEVAKRKG